MNEGERRTGLPAWPDLAAGRASPPRPPARGTEHEFFDEAAGLAAAFKLLRTVFGPYFSAALQATRVAGLRADAQSADGADAEYDAGRRPLREGDAAAGQPFHHREVNGL